MGLGDAISKKIAFVFPGQAASMSAWGRASTRFGRSPACVSSTRQTRFLAPSSSVCFNGPDDELNDTINAQPAIVVVSLAYLEALRDDGIRSVRACRRLWSLVTVGASSPRWSRQASSILLMRFAVRRAWAMKESGDLVPGGMAAVIVGLTANCLRTWSGR